VPVLNTVARHGDSPGIDACAGKREISDWRIAVQTNVVSARVVELACRRHLPLVDLRDALDAADNRGLARDQIHLSTFAGGGGVLDARALRCGNNVRTYVTLRMLAQVNEVIAAR
jgi:hypothetical protein